MFFIALDLDWTGFLPFASIICPKYLILDLKNSHLSKLCFKPYCFIFSTTCLTCLTCFYRLSLLINMSRYAIAKSTSFNCVSMICCKMPGATSIPNGGPLNLNRPLFKYFEHSSLTGIWRYVSNKSSFENAFPSINFANMSSELGRE